LLSQIQLLESRVMGIAEYGLIYILEMNPCMVGNTDWSDRYWHLLVTKIISTHAGREEKLEHRRNDPPLGDERACCHRYSCWSQE
jgi:hypothetical protein